MIDLRPWENVNRDFVKVSSPACSGLEIAIVEEDLCSRPAWTVKAPYHSILVHLAGQLTSHEAKFESGPQTKEIPAAGCIWIIPAGQRFDTIPRGSVVRFCEIRVPLMGPDLELVEVSPRIDVRDELLHEAAQVFQRQVGRDTTSKVSTRHLAEAIHWHIIERYDKNPVRNTTNTKKLALSVEACIVSYINDKIGGRITLEELANATALDIHELLRKFYASFGTTPAQYITRLRLERAKSLLATSSLPMIEIATEVGFHSVSHFCVSFMKHVGIAPVAFRQAQLSALDQGRRR